MANWAGAAISLALVVGVGVWGYKLLVRDVTGIPVVQAMEGPMRVAPENPGGMLADHQGLAVNDVAGTGLATPVPDKLLLAPARFGLSDDDLPADELPKPSVAAQPAPDATAQLGQDGGEMAMADGDSDPMEMLANQIAGDASPFGPVSDETQMQPENVEDVLAMLGAEQEAEAAAAAAEEEGDPEPVIITSNTPAGALVRSLRPKTRPTALSTDPVAAAVTAVTSAPPQNEVQELDPASLPAGTRLAQLGAYDSAETARSEWDRFTSRFGEFMEGKDRVIERATSGGRVFYRLRAAGFEDISDARRFCAAFVAENADCIPVTTR
ncbi:SPOR domain-containing protein [Salipiger pallidus]|nr:SPOR domain-containing protein [Salipiger pallidus]